MLTDLQMLKIELMCKGMKISEKARDKFSDYGKKPLTLAEYATTSGIPLRFENDIWVNSPFLEDFCKTSNLILDFDGKNYFMNYKGKKYKTIPTPVPAFLSRNASTGRPFKYIGITHTDRIRVSPIAGCAYKCKFCDLNLLPYNKKTIQELLETIKVAKNDKILPAKHCLISGGTPRPKDRKWLMNVYKEITQKAGIPVDIMLAAWITKKDLEDMHSWGVNLLSINIEMWDDKLSAYYTPEKHALGRKKYLETIKNAVKIFGKNKVQSLILLGLEPLESILKGVEALAKIGCAPVLSTFRPALKTPLAHLKPPTVKECIEAYEKSFKIAKKYGMKLGPRCIQDSHNTLTFPDRSSFYKYY